MERRSKRKPFRVAWLLLATALAGCVSTPELAPVNMDARAQAETVVERLSDAEKVALTHGSATMYVAANPRRGIPEEFAFSDGPHTVRAELTRADFSHRYAADDLRDAATVFPALSALAATWDPELAQRFGEALGEEARARGKDVMLGPGINLARTPLCGRNYEYLGGEDPCLASLLVVPVIQGIQSKDVAACVKHFAVNSQELNRNNVDARPNIRTLRELYLPAFEAAVKEGGVLCVMSGYNKLNGVHCSHNGWLNNSVLKGEWGFPGLVVTDWGSLQSTIAGANGGTDVEMNAGRAIRYFRLPLLWAVRLKKVPRERLTDMARRVLYVQAKLHKLDSESREEGSINTPEHQALAREIAAASVTLLKNDCNVLPLKAEEVRKVLVVGAIANQGFCREGWSAEGKPPYDITLLDGLREALPGVEIVHEPFPALPTSFTAIPDSCLLTENPDAHADVGMTDRGWLWERFGNDDLAGEPQSTGFSRTPQLTSAEATAETFSVRWKSRLRAPETGEYLFGITVDDGCRLSINGITVIDAWPDGPRRRVSGNIRLEAGKEYDVTLDYRQAKGVAILEFGWRLPSENGAGYTELAEAAKTANVVLLVTGNRKGHGQALECEAGDRPDLRLLPQDDATIGSLLGVNPKTVVIVQSGSPVQMPWIDRAHTLLHHSFLGQEGGRALADVLLGKHEPMGRLVHTWPRRLEDSPAHALHDYHADVVYHREGILIGYRWFDAKGLIPLFPFGYGLSYATFDYGVPEVETHEDGVEVSVDIENVSDCTGTAIVQVYVEPPVSGAVFRAPRQLAAFQKITLDPGERETLTFDLPHRAFAYWDETLHGWQHEAGIFTVAVGNSSRDLPVRAPVPLKAWEHPIRPSGQ